MSKLPVLLAASLFVLAACTKVEEVPVTQVLLNVTSDISDAVGYEVRVTDETEMVQGPTQVITKKPPFTFALVPAAKRPALRNLIIISALDVSGNVLALAKKLVILLEGETTQVEVNLTQACRGRTCDPGFTCTASVDGTGECLLVQESIGTKTDPGTIPSSETMIDGMPGDDAGNGGVGAPSGIAGGSQSGGSASGGMTSGGGASGGEGSGGTASGGAAAGGMQAGGATMGGMGGEVDGGVDPGQITVPECDATRTCSTGYSCVSGMCMSLCAQTTCDPNATCALNASDVPSCTCNAGFLSMAGAGGAVTCMRTQTCTELRCDTNATCEAIAGAQPKCSCRPGYMGDGRTCTPVSCGALTVANGSVNTNGATVGQMAEYTCDTGYVKTGGAARRCEASGMWSGAAPTCQPRDCGTPANPSYGRVTITNGTRYPSGTVRYTCNTGFSLSGSNTDTRTCTANGTWSGTTPTCIGCGDGIVSQSLFEDCEPNASNTWTCIGCKRSNAYQPCGTGGSCPAGLQCHSAGYCTVAPCSSDAVCPAAPSGPVRASCEGGGFACSLLGCTANSQCPPGLRCNTTERFCTVF